MAGRLSDEQVASFRREGYLLFHEPVLPAAEFDALRAHFETKLARWDQESGGRPPEHMDVPHFTDPELFRWLHHPAVLDAVESLIGPDIALWSSHFICKPPGTGLRVPWHEDSSYWGRVLDPMEVVTVWLAIDPATRANGCMRIVPRTHHNGYSLYRPVEKPESQVFATEVLPELFDASTAVDCALAPNECSVHHAKLIHGSEPNTSATRRCGYTMRYVPTSSRFDPESRRPGFQIYLARGQDRAGNEYGDPTKVNRDWVNANPDERRKIKMLAG